MTLAHPSFRASPPVLLCLDLQQDPQAGGPPGDREGRRQCLDACKQVLSRARGLGWKVAHAHRSYARRSLRTGGPKPIPGLEPRASEPVFVRHGPSAFSSGAFQEYLRLLVDPQLAIIGCSLEGSALFTAVSAREAGVPLSLVKGALAARPMGPVGSSVVETVLFGVMGEFTEVLSADELFDRVAGPLAAQAAANLP